MKSIYFEVLGVPAPKGSSRAMMRGGQAVNVPSGSNVNRDALQSWGGAVRAAAIEAVRKVRAMSTPGEVGVFFGEIPLRIQVVFRMRRRKGDFRKDGTLKPNVPRFHRTKPDLGKLLRSTEDSLIGIIVLDDSHFSECFIRKVYADPGKEGAWVRIEELQ